MSRGTHAAVMGVVCLLIVTGGAARAGTIHVPGDYPTIQAGIDAAQPGDRVLVAEGTWRGPGNRDLDFHGKAIKVVSENGAEHCIIDCEGSNDDPHRGFYFHSGETADAEVKGFTITGGDGVLYGGAIRCRNGSSPTIRRCIITDNQARQGSGIFCQEDANPTIIRCTITRARVGHRDQDGGGIYCTGSRATIIECSIVWNVVERSGGGIHCSDGSQLIIQDSTIAHCGAAWSNGGGISSSRSVIRMTGCTIEGCWVGESGGRNGGVSAQDSSLVFTRCTIAENYSNGGSGGVRAPGAVFTDCVIRDNRCGLDGDAGGVWGNGTFTNCLITGNSGDDVGGVYGGGTFTNCVITGNSGGYAGGVWGDGTFTNCLITGNSGHDVGAVTGGTFVSCTIAGNTAENPVPLEGTFVNCIYRGNNETLAGAATYSNVEGGHAGEGNIDADPRFVDPASGDYRLAPGSPCIDAGDNTAVPEEMMTDLDGNPRFADDPDIEDTGNGEPPVVDMGPYEFQGVSCPADLDDSGFVDVADILAVLSVWGPCNGCREDLDGSGVVDFADILIVVAAWGLCPYRPGACCFDDGTCEITDESECAGAGGLFRGEGRTCEVDCSTGACCLMTGCVDVIEEFCGAFGGTYRGHGSTCQEGCQADRCADAIVVTEGIHLYSTRGATDEGPDLPEACDEGRGLLFRRDVWFQYRASCDGVSTASVCDSTFDTRLAVYEYSEDECPGTFIACSDDACGENGTRSEVSFPVESGGTYLIRIGARFAVGEGTLVIDCVE